MRVGFQTLPPVTDAFAREDQGSLLPQNVSQRELGGCFFPEGYGFTQWSLSLPYG